MQKLWHSIYQQAFKFGITGFINTIIDFAIFNLLLYLTGANSPWQLAVINLIAVGVAATNSYLMNRYWTFATGKRLTGDQVMRFIIATTMGLAINTMVVTLVGSLSSQIALPVYLVLNMAKISGALLSSTWNFLVYRNWVFANRASMGISSILMNIQQPGLTSLIIPAYNEGIRLTARFEQLLPMLQREYIELIIVDDGSTDHSLRLAEEFAGTSGLPVTVVAHSHNRGKGAAVATGMAAAKGEYLIFSDADNTFTAEHILAIKRCLQQGQEMAIGCRHSSDGQRMAGESKRRRIMGQGFNYLVQFMILPGITDTQCGLKGFSRPVAQALFGHQRIWGFAFDVEILALARRLGYDIQVIEVSTAECEGSSVKCIPAALAMGMDILRIRWNLSFNLYQLPRPVGSFSWRVAGILFMTALAVRIPWLWEVPRYIDELSEVNLAYSIYTGKVLPLTNMAHDIGPLHNYILAAIFKLLGPSIYWPRLYVALTSALTVVVVYEIGRRLFGKWAGLLAGGLLLTNGMHIMVTHMAWSNSSTPFFFSLAILTLIITEEKKSGPWLIGSALLWAMVMQTHSSGIVYVLAAAVYVLRPGFRQSMQVNRIWYLAGAVTFLLGYGNMIYYNLLTWGGSFSWAGRKSYALEPDPGVVSYLQNCGRMGIELLRSVGSIYPEPTAWTGWTLVGALAVTGVVIWGIKQATKSSQWLPLYMIVAAFVVIPWVNDRYSFYLATRYIMPVIICTLMYASVGAVTVFTLALSRWKRWRPIKLEHFEQLKWPTVLTSVLIIGLLSVQLVPFYRFCDRLTATNESNRMALSILDLVSQAGTERRLVLLDSQLPLENKPLPYLLKLSRQPFIAVNGEGSEINWAKLKKDYPHRTIYAIVGSALYAELGNFASSADVEKLQTRVSIPTPSAEPRQVYVLRLDNP